MVTSYFIIVSSFLSRSKAVSNMYYDGEFKDQDVDVEIQKNVVGTYPDTEHVKFSGKC